MTSRLATINPGAGSPNSSWGRLYGSTDRDHLLLLYFTRRLLASKPPCHSGTPWERVSIDIEGSRSIDLGFGHTLHCCSLSLPWRVVRTDTRTRSRQGETVAITASKTFLERMLFSKLPASNKGSDISYIPDMLLSRPSLLLILAACL